jgi:hypothetical protein
MNGRKRIDNGGQDIAEVAVLLGVSELENGT